jgi:conjugal transfer/type IV secretion protein DotA/TraY
MALNEYTQAAGSDPSLDMLGKVLGSIGGQLPGVDGPFASALFVLNVAVISIATFYLLYSLGAGTVQTAHDGEFLGKRWHSLWMPVRVVAGLGMSIPVIKGWTISQMIFAWAISVGVGMANLAWQAGAGDFLKPGAITPATISIPDAVPEAILHAEICREAWNYVYKGMPAIMIGTPIVVGNSTEAAVVFQSADPLGNCGGARILASDVQLKAGNTASQAQLTTMLQANSSAMYQMAVDLLPLAQAAATHQPVSRAAFDAAKIKYQQSISAAIAGLTSTASGDVANFLQSDGKSWLMAGSLIQQLAEIQKQLAESVSITPEPVHQSIFLGFGAEASEAFEMGDAYWQAAQAQLAGPSGNNDSQGFFSSLFEKNVQSPIMMAGQSALTGGEQNPLLALPHLGNTLVITAGASLIAAHAMAAVSESAVGTRILGSGVGAMTGTIGSALKQISNFLWIVIAIGLYLAYYLPYLPYVIWFSGILTWSIICIEGIVAAGLWSLTFLDTEGEGLPQRTHHGFIFLCNLFLRPTLMVLGLLAGYLLMLAAYPIMQKGLAALFGATPAGVGAFLLWLGGLLVFVLLTHLLINKTFSLIHVLPDQVITWLGGNLASTTADHEATSGKALNVIQSPTRPGGIGGIGKGGGGGGSVSGK